MITLAESKQLHKQGVFIAGMRPQPDFSISTKTDIKASKNIKDIKELEKLLNKNLKLNDYISSNLITTLFFTYLIFPLYNDSGINRKERKYYSKKRKFLYLDLKILDYDAFCNASSQEAMNLMANLTLQGIQKYLPQMKKFDDKKFHADLTALFQKHKLIGSKNLY